MSIQLVITSQEAGLALPLQVEVSGYRLALSDMAPGSRLVVAADGGGVAVRLEAVEVMPPAAEGPLPVEVAQPEAVAPVVLEADKAAEAEEAVGPVAEPPAGQASEVQESAAAEQLFQQLVALRKKVAAEVRLPPYIIFHDSTLKDMSRLLPTDLQALGTIQGVGKAKLEKYGSRFIEAIRQYAGEVA